MVEPRLKCTNEGCGASGPGDAKAKWINEPDLKLVYIETRKEEQVSADVSGGQCSVKDVQYYMRHQKVVLCKTTYIYIIMYFIQNL